MVESRPAASGRVLNAICSVRSLEPFESYTRIPSMVTRRDVRYSADYTLSTFEPLDEHAMADARAWLGFEAVAFASTREGDAIYLRRGPAEADVVSLTHHDGGDTKQFAATLHDMVEILRPS